MNIGLKRLRASDLGWFRELFDPTVSKQKGFNIDKATLVQMFPDFDRHARERGYSFTIPVTLYGPGSQRPVAIERKLLLQAKNWRLNGEFIKEDGRFASLQPSDLAIIGFEGTEFPTGAYVIILSASDPEDRKVLSLLEGAYGEQFGNRKGFVALSSEAVRSLFQGSDTTPPRGLDVLLDAGDVEEAALGNAVAIARISRRGGLSRSRDQLREARERAEMIGQLGEELVFEHLMRRMTEGEIDDFTWTSQDNAVALYDFEVVDGNGTRRIEVKTTAGAFETPLHISYGELAVMSSREMPHDLYRVFQATESGGQLSVATDTAGVAERVIHAVAALVDVGIVPESFTVNPKLLEFERPRQLDRFAIEPEDE